MILALVHVCQSGIRF